MKFTHRRIGQLLQALHDMNDSLAVNADRVRSNTEAIARASRENACGNAGQAGETAAAAGSNVQRLPLNLKRQAALPHMPEPHHLRVVRRAADGGEE